MTTLTTDLVAMVGCWGNINTNYGGKPMMAVMSEIGSRSDISCLQIAGDNYYVKNMIELKDGIEKVKHHLRVSEIENVMKALPTNMPVDMVLGNHEMEPKKIIVKDKKVKDPDSLCLIAEQEIEVIDRVNATRDNKIVLHKLGDNSVKYMHGDCYIYLDTTILIPTIKTDCYEKLFSKKNRNTIIKTQFDEICSHITTNKYKRTFFIGHHPPVTFRNKHEKGTVETTINHLLIKFMTNIVLEKKLPDVHYLCADFHIYQHIRMKSHGVDFNVHIVGTGGARLDNGLIPGRIDNKLIALLEDSIHTFDGATVERKGDLVSIISKDLSFTLVKTLVTYGYLCIGDTIQFKRVLMGGRTRRKRRYKRHTKTK